MLGETCIELFSFAVNSISSKKQPNKHNFGISHVDEVPHPELFLDIPVHVPGPGFNESIGERTVRQTDQQRLWLYLVDF